MNAHSPRDFVVDIVNMSDVTLGQSGFRFARIELVTEQPVWIRNIFAVNTIAHFPKEGYIRTDDEALNRIIDTALYTLKLNFQNGYIWDGIKRDRIVWSGDLNQEIVTSLYLFGDNSNITNSLSFLREDTPEGSWINTIPSYSAWWVINLCDYCSFTGNSTYFEENRDYAREIFANLNAHVSENGEIDFCLPADAMSFYLDWPTYDTPDAKVGTAALMVYAAKKFLLLEENEECRELIRKLSGYLTMPCQFKQTRAFQILAGRDATLQSDFLEAGNAKGFSTFMAYYILKADALAKGSGMLAIIKEYFGAMLERGATTFWEDFHMEWLEGSSRIDEFPAEGQKDIHGDFGAFCYQGFRHSLCHGWSSGVLAFLIEEMIGLKLCGSDRYEIHPNLMEVDNLEAQLCVGTRWITIRIHGDQVEVTEQNV